MEIVTFHDVGRICFGGDGFIPKGWDENFEKLKHLIDRLLPISVNSTGTNLPAVVFILKVGIIILKIDENLPNGWVKYISILRSASVRNIKQNCCSLI